MAAIDRYVDALQLFLTGGATNINPDLSLGGVASATRVRGLGAIVASPIPAIRVDNVLPACGEGEATLSVDTDGSLVFTPPGGGPGGPVALAAGSSAIIPGSDANKALRVYREPGLTMPEGQSSTLTLVEMMNGIIGQKNLTNAQRVAGATTYRALMLKSFGTVGANNIRIWFPPVSGTQAVYSVATEEPVSGAIQTIANELVAPVGLTWATPTTEAGPFDVGTINAGNSLGLWIRKVFPPGGTVDPLEKVQMAIKFLGD